MAGVHPETILAICAVLTLFGAVFVWINKQNMAPFKILISSNTKAMEDLSHVVSVHADKLVDHGERITAIETKHRVRHGE